MPNGQQPSSAEQRYRSLFEQNLDAVFSVDREGRFIDANPAAEALSGYSVAELRQLTWQQIFAPEDIEKTLRTFQQGLRGQRNDLETALIRKDDRRIDLFVTGSPVIVDGQIVGIFAIARDIGEQKRTENALRESEARLEFALNSSGMGVWDMDVATNMTWHSPTHARIYGYDVLPQWSYGKFLEHVHPDDWPIVNEPFQRGVASKESWRLECRIRRVDGQQRWIEIFAHPRADAAGKVTRLMGLASDITERKQAQSELVRTMQRLDMAQAAGRVGTFDWDLTPDGVIMGSGLGRVFGTLHDEYHPTYEDWRRQVHPEDIERVDRELNDALAGKADYETEYRIIWPDGTTHWVAARGQVQRDEQGRPLRMIGINIDLTDRKQAEESLRQSETRLRTLNEELERRVEERTARLTAAAKALEEENARRAETEALLRASEEKYRIVVEAASEAIATFDENGLTLFMNQTAARSLGGEPEDFVGKTQWDLFPKAVADEQVRNICRVIRSGKSEMIESVTELRGERRDAQAIIEPLKDASGRISSALVIARDVTEQRRAERTLHESEQKYHRLFDTVSDAIVLWDVPTRQIIDVNRSAERLYGYSREEFLRLSENDLTAEPEESEKAIARMLAGEAIRIPLRYHRRKDGTAIPLELSASHFFTDERHVASGVARDLTDRIQAQRQLEIYQQDLQSLASQVLVAEEQVRRRLAIDLHDGFTQILSLARIRLDLVRNMPGAEKLDRPLRGVGELLDKAIQTAGNLTDELSPPILVELGFMPAAQWLGERIEQTYGLRVRISDDGRAWPDDEQRNMLLFRCLRELLINAAKHSGAAEARVILAQKEQMAQLVVEDDGAGFDPGDTLRPVLNRDRRTAFGLLSIRERLRHLGGGMDIRSAPGQGTTVTIIVPVDAPRPGLSDTPT